MKKFNFDNYIESIETAFWNVKNSFEAKANEKAVDGVNCAI